MQSNEITIFGVTLPTVIVAALMGSALTLLGVFLQNLFENCRTDKKLKHEAEEKEKDRKFHAKREIYLNAAEEIAKAARFLMRFSEVHLSQAEHSVLLVGYDAAIAKVHLVGKLTKALCYCSESAERRLQITLKNCGALMWLHARSCHFHLVHRIRSIWI